MTPQELKNSILQLAIQGKLVEQRQEEGTAEELYRQIQQEKQRLIREGKIKKEKLLPEIAEEEKPFDIPENWKWTRLDDLVVKEIKRGKSPVYTAHSNTLVFAQKCNTKAGYIDMSLALSLDESKLSKYPDAEFMQEYIYYGLKYYQPFMEKLGSGSTNQTELSASIVSMLVFPLPPLTEQQRIVAKIEELLPLIDRYEKAWSQLEEFNKRFPEDMQKSILQMAIQGKLVEQQPEEGTGEELYQQIRVEICELIEQKKFKKKAFIEIKDEDIPYEIPGTWKWVRLGDIISIESGNALTSTQMAGGAIPVYGGNGITGYHNESLVPKGTVVIGRVGYYCGSVHVTESEAWVTDNAFITTYPRKGIIQEYLVYMLRQMNLGKDNNATAQPVVSGKKIYPLLFPLPPLPEQKRIVNKLNELLPICERLKR